MSCASTIMVEFYLYFAKDKSLYQALSHIHYESGFVWGNRGIPQVKRQDYSPQADLRKLSEVQEAEPSPKCPASCHPDPASDKYPGKGLSLIPASVSVVLSNRNFSHLPVISSRSWRNDKDVFLH